MNDNELFELCKEVYKVKKWEFNTLDTKYFIERDDRCEQIPVYTSDYILPKLCDYDVSIRSDSGEDGRIITWYGSLQLVEPEEVLNSQSDTPLKALLKLTLELHKAGEL